MSAAQRPQNWPTVASGFLAVAHHPAGCRAPLGVAACPCAAGVTLANTLARPGQTQRQTAASHWVSGAARSAAEAHTHAQRTAAATAGALLASCCAGAATGGAGGRRVRGWRGWPAGWICTAQLLWCAKKATCIYIHLWPLHVGSIKVEKYVN